MVTKVYQLSKTQTKEYYPKSLVKLKFNYEIKSFQCNLFFVSLILRRVSNSYELRIF